MGFRDAVPTAPPPVCNKRLPIEVVSVLYCVAFARSKTLLLISTNESSRCRFMTPSGVAFPVIAIAPIRLLTAIDHPNAFYVRLLNKNAEDFPNVERFFREIVDPTVQKMGYRRLEMGTDRTEHGFINVGIFERLHYSELAIVDVTGERPNCFVELGYALGHGVPVIVTAKEGTTLPFDQQAIPCHFWNLETDAATNRKLLLEFIEKNIGRPPLVTA